MRFSPRFVCSRPAGLSRRAPWGLALPGSKTCVRFHYMVRGSAWLSVDNMDEPNVALSGGDLAVLPLGHAHVLRDHPRSATVRVDDVGRCDSRSVIMQLEVGAKGPETNFVTGAFVLDDPLARQMWIGDSSCESTCVKTTENRDHVA